MDKSEQDIQSEIRMALSPIAMIFRINTGKVRMKDGRFFDTGTVRGYPDLSGFRFSDGKAIFIEVKNAKGKASKHQKHFLEQVGQYDVISGIARSASEAVELVKNG